MPAVLFAGFAYGANLASDQASNYGPPAWNAGSNEGSGFGAWSFSTSGSGGSFLGGTGEGNPSFGVFAGGNGGGDLSSASRSFTGGALTAGQSFEIDLGHTTDIDSGVPGEVGLNLTDGGTTVFTLKFVGGQSNWLLNDGGTDFGAGQAYDANTSIAFSFTYEGSNDYSYTFGTGSGSNINAVNTISGIDGFKLFSNNQGGGENFGADNPSVVPEPSSYALLFGLAGLTFAMVRRRK